MCSELVTVAGIAYSGCCGRLLHLLGALPRAETHDSLRERLDAVAARNTELSLLYIRYVDLPASCEATGATIDSRFNYL